MSAMPLPYGCDGPDLGPNCPIWHGNERLDLAFALDDHRSGRIDHVDIADSEAIALEHILPVTAGPLARADIELENAQIFLAVSGFFPVFGAP